jgi:hypothetical protein
MSHLLNLLPLNIFQHDMQEHVSKQDEWLNSSSTTIVKYADGHIQDLDQVHWKIFINRYLLLFLFIVSILSFDLILMIADAIHFDFVNLNLHSH